MGVRILRVLFVAYLAATCAHIGWVMHHEPFSFDAWNLAVDTKAEPATIDRFFAYWRFEYTHSNPRLGQPLTYLAYKLQYIAEILTPLAFALVAVAVVILGTGRWPKRSRDLALIAIALGFAWFSYPQLGKVMFCRAYGANYVYGAAIQLWFLVPLRLSSDGRTSTPRAVLYGLAGVAAGLCNEHTGPTLCLGLLAYAIWLRRGNLAWAGAIGAIVGFAAIFFAPGQNERYSELAARVSLGGRLIQRGITGNGEIFRQLVFAAAPVLALMVVAFAIATEASEEMRARTRGALRLIAIAMIAATLITMTIFVSPKLGPRFYLLPMALILAGFIALVDALAVTLVPFVVLAALASLYAAWQTIPLYGRLARESTARLAALDATKPGTVATIDAFEQVDDSWWFLGDDFRDILKRELISDYYDLAGVVLRAYDPTAPLGVSDVRLVPHYELEPASCLDDHGGLELDAYRGLDVASIQKAMQDGIAPLRARLGTAGLDKLDLAVDFVGDRPALPRKTLLVGRWRPDRFEGWAGTIARKTRSTTRDVVVPKTLPRDLEIFIYAVGGVAKRLGTSNGEPLQYVPWRSGTYWALACRVDECFVIAAAHQGGS